jgi:hypothetical protein
VQCCFACSSLVQSSEGERKRKRVGREKDGGGREFFLNTFMWHEGLLYKLMESGVGGKTYDTIKSIYTC